MVFFVKRNTNLYHLKEWLLAYFSSGSSLSRILLMIPYSMRRPSFSSLWAFFLASSSTLFCSAGGWPTIHFLRCSGRLEWVVLQWGHKRWVLLRDFLLEIQGEKFIINYNNEQQLTWQHNVYALSLWMELTCIAMLMACTWTIWDPIHKLRTQAIW